MPAATQAGRIERIRHQQTFPTWVVRNFAEISPTHAGNHGDALKLPFYEVWVDGERLGANCFFRYPAKEIHRLSVLTMGGGGMNEGRPSSGFAVDNVVVYATRQRPPDGSSVERVKDSGAKASNTVAMPAGKPGYELTFQDEFEGHTLNRDLCKFGRFPSSSRNLSETEIAEFYPYEMKDGALMLRVEKRRDKTFTTSDTYIAKAMANYTAPAIATWDKFEQEYGWFEIRCRMPKTVGIWTGFWCIPSKGKPGMAEIDIFESLTRYLDKMYFNVHFQWDPKPYPLFAKQNIRVPGVSEDFHTYALNWEPEKLTLFVDGVQVYEHTGKDVPFGPLYLIVSCRTDGWAGEFIDEQGLPDHFEIDYVRVYKKQ